MGLVSYGVSGLLSTATVFGIAITVQEHPLLPDVEPQQGVIELRSQPENAVVDLVSGDSGAGQKTGQKAGQKRQKIKINLQVEQPEDLQVGEGDRVLAGQILADQTSTRRALEQQRNQLLISIDQLAVPMAPIPELPPPDFGVEQAGIAAAQTGIKALDAAPRRKTRFRQPELTEAWDQAVLERNWEVRVKQVESRVELNRAIANLQRAESAYSWQRYQHGLNLQRQQETRQRQQFQIASLQADLWAVEQKLQELSVVRSPYSGLVQRLRVLGQEGRMLNVELVLVVKDEAE